jgi:hypothetical protein
MDGIQKCIRHIYLKPFLMSSCYVPRPSVSHPTDSEELARPESGYRAEVWKGQAYVSCPEGRGSL